MIVQIFIPDLRDLLGEEMQSDKQARPLPLDQPAGRAAPLARFPDSLHTPSLIVPGGRGSHKGPNRHGQSESDKR